MACSQRLNRFNAESEENKMSDEQSLALVQPQLTPAQFKKNHEDLAKFVKTQLREAKNMQGGDSGDYGIIPFTKKMSLLKPGAEKLLKLFGFVATFELVKEIEDWDKRFIYYRYRCTIKHGPTGTFIADAVRSCNNKEKKHANKDVYEVANTIESVAQKRALVAATVQATMASEIFDADVSENEETAPNKPITKEEDPRRVKVTSALYGTATRHGLDDSWIHKAAKKKFGVESLSELSNTQLEEITEAINEFYEEVPKGEKPILKKQASQPETENSGEVMEGEIMADTGNQETVDLDEVDKALPADTPEETTTEEATDTNVGTPMRDPSDCGNPECDKGVDGKRAKARPGDPWCSDECKEEYYPDLKKKPSRFAFNREESAEQVGLPEQTV